MINPETLHDGYKFGHPDEYPKKTTRVYSNWTARGSRIEGQDEETFCGLQYFLQEYMINRWKRDFFDQPLDVVLARFKRRKTGYLGASNKAGEDRIEALWRLGYLPLEFKALPEGTRVPMRVPSVTVENTLDDFYWLTNNIETIMSCTLWLPCTSATTARYYRDSLLAAAKTTGTPEEFIDWQGHDFSMRGMPGLEAAMLSGFGHLLYFTGSDTVPAIDFIEDYYGAIPEGYLIAGSVNATEHAVMCAGSKDDEIGTFKRLMTEVHPTGILSIVSDTWDLWSVLTKILPALKDTILAREGKIVIRPDSGDPVDILCGDAKALPGSPAFKGVVELLWEVFGGTKNDAGYRVLDQHIGTIYGDSITIKRAEQIAARLAAKGFASINFVLGIGSYTYQYVTRDTFGHAMKATWVMIDGVGRDIFKDPVTDNGLKKSACGRLAVVRDANNKLICIEKATPAQEALSLLRPSWRDGKFIVHESFDVIRARARAA